jgi:response regulator RpfG family c-di-GMP phosphodiesterase
MDDFVRKPYRFNEIYECLTKQLGVQYTYIDAQEAEEVSNVVLTAQMLAVLPEDLRHELHDAVESLEDERITAVIQQVASYDSKLYKTLSYLAENFDYPAGILTKPGRLTALEFAIIKEHAQSGHEILKSIDFPWPSAQIVLQHHERLDGSGYPQALKSDQILLEAKIIAVGDVVESMMSHRPYRPELGLDAALAEIELNKGKLYNPAVADACIKLFREQGFNFSN